MRAGAIIEGVLRDAPDTRSSDSSLYIEVWEKLGFFMSESQKAKFHDLPTAETISRVRRKLQQEGKYLATKKVRDHRNFKGMEVQQKMPTTPSDKVEPLLNAIHDGDMQRATTAAKKIVNDIPRFNQ
jgi:hypothetical protein